jgi:hypothetical protein
MHKTYNPSILRLISVATKYKMFYFMASIIMLLILSAVMEEYKYGYLVINTTSTIVFVLGIYAMGRNKKNVIILILLGMPWFLSEWVFTKSSETIFASVLFFLFITGTIIDNILHSEEVSTDTLYEAVCVFLLLGILWAIIYGFLEYITPGIIFVNNNAEVLNPLTSTEKIYYSYTTLTSLGYGDITSLHPVGRIVSVLEAITGQLFVAFFIARLVAIYTANALRRRSDS